MLSLPTPKNWQDFESLCHRLWKEFWADPNTQKNGRVGQAQNGVDIFGFPYRAERYHGVQCKGKNSNYRSELTKRELETESSKAESFRPNLESFVIATSSPRNANIQELCRTMNIEKKRPFKVDVWSWDDIEEEIQCRQDIMNDFYPAIKVEVLPKKIFLNPFASYDRIGAFFSRPNISTSISYDYIHILYSLVYELMDNSFTHGKASECSLKIENDCMEIVDNGQEFDPCSLLLKKRGGGSQTMALFFKRVSDNVDFQYFREEGKNILLFKFRENVISKNINDSFEITLDNGKNPLCGRDHAQQLAIKDFSTIPQGKSRIVVNVAEGPGLALSIVYGYFGEALHSLKENQHLIVYMPTSFYDSDDLKECFEDQRIKFLFR